MVRLSALTALIALAFCLDTALAQMVDKVAFETPPVPPSAFKLKRAQAQGKTIEPTPGVRLSGILSRPEGDGPHPAVIVLPEGDGQREPNRAWGRFLSENGFVALFIESFAARGKVGFDPSAALDMVVDAQSGYRFLRGLDYVDGKRIGLMGFSHSGWFVLRTLDAGLKEEAGDIRFGAGVALYPACDPETRLVAPVLIIAGERDTRISLAACQAMVDLNNSSGTPAELHIYPGVMHSFDNANYSSDPAVRGENWSEPVHFEQGRYDPEARADAERRVLDFFRLMLR